MKVAVTGASGFVGSHVVRALAALEGVELIASSRSPIAPDRLPAGVRHVAFDIASASGDAHARLGAPDVLVHLAWGGLPNYLSPHHLESELPAQYRFLRAMVEAGLPSLLVTGTCYEYGMQSGELDESMAGAPGNPYAQAKAALREKLELLQASVPFALTWARLFYSWGDGQAPTSLYPLLRAAVARGDRSFAMSRGDQVRDYLPIEDAARDLAALAVRAPGAGIVNVCSGKPVSVRSMVEGWLAMHGWGIALDLGKYPYPAYEPLAFWGSRARLDELLGPNPAPGDI